MKLIDLIKDIIDTSVPDTCLPARQVEISDITLSSRDVKKGSLFIALRGSITDGHNFIDDAIEKGAVAVVCEKLPKEQKENVIYIRTESTKNIAGPLASRFFGDPSQKLKVVGVTGTNGKTTTTTLLYELFEKLGYKTGLLSTIVNKIHKKEILATHTTPDQITLQRTLAEMVDVGCEYCFMEVSSHALDQGRTVGIDFAGAVFMNVTHDHLDYHGTFDNYMRAKQKLFNGLHPHAWALANADDENGAFMLQNTQAPSYFYSLKKEDGSFSGLVHFEGIIGDNSFHGLVIDINGHVINSRLIGKFNAYNLSAVFGAALLLQQEPLAVVRAMGELHPAEGRFDVHATTGKIGIIDYAHTPDALENVLATIHQIKKPDQKVITVVGCGGNRDAEKRPIMGRIAAEYSDYVILTSDNPRDEEALAIIAEMKKGLPDMRDEIVFTIPDRTEAIDTAVYTARPGDIILVAGKGHETYQEIKGEKFEFSDKKVLEEKLRKYK
jgi:UDP-N-acetylmuramoyl-L-alanyl-D-glutamate--2,6-diaminopimelate ligase